MEEIEISSLLSRDLFEKFREQMKRDFEGAGLDASFTQVLPLDLESLLTSVEAHIPFQKASALSSLLYRIDLSERQIGDYGRRFPQKTFGNLIAELVIRRILQKVVLKKRFSAKGHDQERID